LTSDGFTWRDGERTIRFGRGALATAPELVGDRYTLLTTVRARAAAPDVAARAAHVHTIPAGRVDELAAGLRGSVTGELLVALGGGRVVDVAKALAAAAGPPVRVAAIPTTLSAAEMTSTGRHAAGVDPSTPRVRPAIVLNDPALSASQPVGELAASAANALAHAVESAATAAAPPVPVLAAGEAVRRIDAAWVENDPDRDGLALGALLSGYAIGATGYGLHHVLSQTIVRLAGAGHGPANAALLPHTIRALRRRCSGVIDADGLARRLAAAAGARRLRDIGVAEDRLDACALAAAERRELRSTPPPAQRDEILAIYREAW
jgi:alcohol dehydrogenase class IV